MFRIIFTEQAHRWNVQGDKAKVIEWEGRTYPYNEKFEEWLRYFKSEQVQDFTFGQDKPTMFIDVERLRGVIEI